MRSAEREEEDLADFSRLVDAILRAAEAWQDPEHEARASAVARTLGLDNRFTAEAVAFAVNQQMHALSREAIAGWLQGRRASVRRTVGVLNPGNVPLVELQDLLAVVLTGHRYRGTLSSRSPHLLQAFLEEIRQAGGSIDAEFVDVERLFGESDAVIATGTDETRQWAAERCEEQRIPPANRLLRGNRIAMAIVDGSESEDELEALAEDALLHEGFGCRNVALIWAPEDLEPDPLLNALAKFRGVFPAHPDSPGALSMQKAFLEAVGRPHAYGEGLEFLLSKGDPEVQSPGHIRWTPYANEEEAISWARANESLLQLVVTNERRVRHVERALQVPVDLLGSAQRPTLDWRPDCVDTVQFLIDLVDRPR